MPGTSAALRLLMRWVLCRQRSKQEQAHRDRAEKRRRSSSRQPQDPAKPGSATNSTSGPPRPASAPTRANSRDRTGPRDDGHHRRWVSHFPSSVQGQNTPQA